MSKKVKSFQVAVGNEGRELRLEFKFEDDTREQVDFDSSVAPRLVQSLIQGAAAAEKIQNAEAGDTVSANVPWRSRDVRAGSVIGNDDLIAVGFATEEGPPVVVVLPRTIAERTIRSILDELRKTAKPQ